MALDMDFMAFFSSGGWFYEIFIKKRHETSNFFCNWSFEDNPYAPVSWDSSKAWYNVWGRRRNLWYLYFINVGPRTYGTSVIWSLKCIFGVKSCWDPFHFLCILLEKLCKNTRVWSHFIFFGIEDIKKCNIWNVFKIYPAFQKK